MKRRRLSFSWPEKGGISKGLLDGDLSSLQIPHMLCLASALVVHLPIRDRVACVASSRTLHIKFELCKRRRTGRRKGEEDGNSSRLVARINLPFFFFYFFRNKKTDAAEQQQNYYSSSYASDARRAVPLFVHLRQYGSLLRGIIINPPHPPQ